MFRHHLITLFVFTAGLGHAQNTQHSDRCKAHAHSQRLLQQQGLPTDLQSALPHVQGELRGSVLTVPVVVHVVYNNTSENVPAAAINAMIAEMNADFSQSNADVAGVRPAFTGNIANAEIEFCLAQFDPAGNPTSGITRTSTTETWFDPDLEYDDMKSAPKGIAPWNPSQYLNIWICDITSGATGGMVTLGYAYLPVGGVVGTGIDGLVVDYQYGLQPGSRTATHEIGHYLGLEHTWADDDGCGDDDGFTDTPHTDTPTFSCANTSLQKCGVLTQYENFMDYSNCAVMFTTQQRAYMRGILSGVRSGLLASGGCGTIVPGDLCIPTSANGTADGDFINTVSLGSINNINSGGTTAPTYTDFSSSWSTALQLGSTHTLSIQGGDYQPDHYAAWIDYDQDEVFEANEKLGEFVTEEVLQTGTINFTVPSGALPGNTIMRVRGVFHNTGEPSPTDPCYNYGYGETEDYGIEIVAGSGELCVPTAEVGTAEGDFINGVILGNINYVNSGGLTAPAYSDLTATSSTTLAQGSTHNLTIQGGDYAPDHYAAWIDHDQDGLFEPGEKLGEFVTSTLGQSQVISFTVPAGATPGTTVLRVRGVYHNEGEPSPTDPCFNYAFGETEDHAIVIEEGTVTGPCIPLSEFGTSDGDYINGVTLQDIVNTNSGSQGGPSYTAYSDPTTTLVRGIGYEMVIQGGDYYPDNYAAWIDMDGDDAFSDTEKLGEFTTDGTLGTGTISFTIPNSASLGATTLRVRGVYHGEEEPSPTDPCFAYAYGETEDYLVTIEQITAIGTNAMDRVLIYPNPAKDLLTVQLHGPGPISVELMDATGRIMSRHQSNSDKVIMPVAGFCAGQYFVKVINEGMIRMLPVQLVD